MQLLRNSSMITPYKYRYKLGRETVRTKNNKYQVYHNGVRHEIESKEVEFMSDHKLTTEEFNKTVAGTVGIIEVKGEFEMEHKILYVTRNSDIYKVNTESFETTSERYENVYAVNATEDGVMRDFSGELVNIKAGDWMFVKNSRACKVEKVTEMLTFLRSEYTKNNEVCKASEPLTTSDCCESY